MPTFTFPTESLEEGDSFELFVAYWIISSTVGPPIEPNPFQFTYSIAGDADPSDYTVEPRFDFFTQGNDVDFSTYQRLTFLVTALEDDDESEVDENFTITIDGEFLGLEDSQGTTIHPVVIRATPLEVSISADDADKEEGDSGTTPFTFTVSLSEASESKQTVEWSISGKGVFATADDDFANGPITQVVTFEPGETSKTVTVQVAGDTKVETDENFTVTLSNPSSDLTIREGSADGTIRTDTVNVTASLSRSEIYEGGDATVLNMQLSRMPDYPIVARVFVDQGQSDFSSSSMLTVVNDEPNISLNAIVDRSAEPKEAFTIDLSTLTPDHEINIQTKTLDLVVIDQQLSPSPSGAAADVKVWVDNIGKALLAIARVNTVGADAQLIKYLSKVKDSSNQKFDVVILLADFAARYSAANGNLPQEREAMKQLFIGVVDAYVALAAEAVGSVAGAALLAATGPGGAYLGKQIGGAIAAVAYNEELSGYVKIYAGQFWDDYYNVQPAPQQVTRGPVSGASVFVDTNADGRPNDGEPLTTTDANGWFWLPRMPGTVVSLGGVDIATGQEISVPLRAIEGTNIVSPLATIVATLLGRGAIDPNLLAFQAFGLASPTGSDTFDLAGAAIAGDVSALNRFAVEGKIYATVLAIGTALASRGGVTVSSGADAVFAVLASKISSLPAGGVVDLDNLDEIQSLIVDGSTLLGSVAFDPTEIEAIAKVVKAFNELATEAVAIPDAPAAVARLIQIEKVAGGSVANAIAQTAAGALSFQQLVSDYSGANLTTLVLMPPTVSIAGSSALVSEGDAGHSVFQFVVTQQGDSSVSHDVLWSVEGSGANAANQADFDGAMPFGVLTFEPGETRKEFEVNAAGDLELEADEQFTVRLSSPSLGLLIGTSAAVGTIQNDDNDIVPHAVDDKFITDENTLLLGNVLVNDTTSNSDTLVVTAIGGDPLALGHQLNLPSGATLRIGADGAFSYSPTGAFDDLAAGETFTDVFSYTASDGQGRLASAKVEIEVKGVDDASTIVEAFGATQLEQDASAFRLLDLSGDGPTLKGDNIDVVPGSFDAWTPIGAEAAETGYLVAWKNAAADEYTIWNTDPNGNYLWDPIGIVRASNAVWDLYEPIFQQDLNADGRIGPGATPTATIEAFGATRLEQGADAFHLLGISGGGTTLKGNNIPVVPGSFDDWVPIGAEAAETGYLIAWKNGQADEYTVWNTDPDGNYLWDPIGIVTASSEVWDLYEPIFEQDLNGDQMIASRSSLDLL